MAPSATVIIPTYNQPAFLNLVLLLLQIQSRGDFAITVADYGSGPETREVVERHAREGRWPARYVWREDAGFRKTIHPNEAVGLAAKDFLVLNDGVCRLTSLFRIRRTLVSSAFQRKGFAGKANRRGRRGALEREDRP